MNVVGGNKVQIKISDPLFLHSSDHPGQALVPLVANIFNREAFDNWRRSMRIVLSSKQKLSFIVVSMPSLVLILRFFLTGKDEMTWFFPGFLIFFTKIVPLLMLVPITMHSPTTSIKDSRFLPK